MTTTLEATSAVQLVQRAAATPRTDPRWTYWRARAIEAWLPMAHRLARRYVGDIDELEDLRQVATVGLIKAVDGFDLGCGGNFVAYAAPTIVGEIKRYFRDRCWTIRPPRRLHDLYLRVRQAQPDLAQRLGHRPTAAEMATCLGVSVEEVIEALECAYARRAGSLSAPVRASGVELGETLPADRNDYHAVELHHDLRRAIAGLDDRQQQIISLYFYGNQSQAQIGRRLGLSQMHVSRLIAAALAVIRDQLEARPIAAAGC
jgi:RNA polymerase sigma-B factor